MTALIDPRIELISIIHYIGEYRKTTPVITSNNSEYTESIDRCFKKWVKHDAVLFSDSLVDKGFGYDAPHALMLHYHLSGKLEKANEFTEYILTRIDESDIRLFIGKMNDFIAQTDFMGFFKDTQSTYAGIIDHYRPLMERIRCDEVLVDYYGYAIGSYTVFLAPLACGNFGINIRAADGSCNLYSILGVDGRVDGKLPDIVWLESTAWHEFGHTYVHKAENKHKAEIAKMEVLFKPIADKMVINGNAYPTWEICLNEHIVRAVTDRLILKYYGPEKHEKYRRWHIENNFIYLDVIEKRLEEYEENRDRYKTFDEFYGNILDALKIEAKNPS